MGRGVKSFFSKFRDFGLASDRAARLEIAARTAPWHVLGAACATIVSARRMRATTAITQRPRRAPVCLCGGLR